MRHRLLPLLLLLVAVPSLHAAEWSVPDAALAEYFALETRKLQETCLAEVQSADDWIAKCQAYRVELFEMLGLDPIPPKTDLNPTITGRVERGDIVVEKLHFQSRPGLYVTANLYRPKEQEGPLPGILYVCGHGSVKKDGVSYGNKASYQHHAAWFAENGYVCLIIDTLQLGEIEGIHHGTYKYGRWWWNNRGYTPAGVEAWNCIRALDYMQSREEIDPEKLGVTGRSGGGAYSWWITALDERITASAPTAGVTDMQNHVVDGCVEGHCDCMFQVNTYRWDYPKLVALAAPRHLLVCNTDNDSIFPLDGVTRCFMKARRVYELLGKRTNIGLVIVPGPHKDTQSLRVPVFTWFNQHLKGMDAPIAKLAEKRFTPEELKVFAELPRDELNTKIDETFVPAAEPPVPESKEAFAEMREGWMNALREKVFRGWPAEPGGLTLEKTGETRFGPFRRVECVFTSQEAVRLPLLVFLPETARPKRVRVVVPDDPAWTEYERMNAAAAAPQPEWPADEIRVLVAARGIGPAGWKADERKRTQIRRRFMLLGQTLDGMRAWDVRRGIQAIRELAETKSLPLVLEANGAMGGIALYASLFEPDIAALHLVDCPTTHREGPIFLNVRRFLDMPQALAMAAERSELILGRTDERTWPYLLETAERLGLPKERIRIEEADFKADTYHSEAAGVTIPYRLLAPKASDAASNSRPLILFLHGAGERGTDNAAQLVHGKAFMRKAAAKGCYVLVPQCPPEMVWAGRHWSEKKASLTAEPSAPMKAVMELIGELEKRHPIDPKRRVILGLSMGGYGTWDAIQRWPEKFIAAAPICGGGDPENVAQLKNLRIWVFHGERDVLVPPVRSRSMVEALKTANGDVKYTEYPGVGHNSWVPAFAEEGLLEWMLGEE